MKNLLHAFAMTQTMFSAFPFPQCRWSEQAKKYMLLFFPVVGLEIGLLWAVADRLLRLVDAPHLIYGLVLLALPYFCTGFIHLDGFMDVADAIGSWRELEQRRAILKDSHVGAFAVIWVSFLLLAGFAVFASAGEQTGMGCLILLPVVSRCCSALAVWRLPPIPTSQYAGQEKTPSWCVWTVLGLLICCVAVGFLVWGRSGAALLACVAGYGVMLWQSTRLLGGMNGDISGCCLTVGELCGAAMLVLI